MLGQEIPRVLDKSRHVLMRSRSERLMQSFYSNLFFKEIEILLLLLLVVSLTVIFLVPSHAIVS